MRSMIFILHSVLVLEFIGSKLNDCMSCMLQETFQWNGITSKKKGQKWGMEKTPHSRKSDYKDLNPELPETLGSEKEIPVDDPIDFNKLELCTTLPEVCFFPNFHFAFMDIGFPHCRNNKRNKFIGSWLCTITPFSCLIIS